MFAKNPDPIVDAHIKTFLSECLSALQQACPSPTLQARCRELRRHWQSQLQPQPLPPPLHAQGTKTAPLESPGYQRTLV